MHKRIAGASCNKIGKWPYPDLNVINVEQPTFFGNVEHDLHDLLLDMDGAQVVRTVDDEVGHSTLSEAVGGITVIALIAMQATSFGDSTWTISFDRHKQSGVNHVFRVHATKERVNHLMLARMILGANLCPGFWSLFMSYQLYLRLQAEGFCMVDVFILKG